MIKGMTGFGSAQIATGQIKAVIEVNSLNHRYLDINYHLPVGFISIENKINQMVQKDIERGRVTISLKLACKSAQEIFLNRVLVKKYFHYARALEKEFGLKNNLSLSDLIKLPGVVEIKETFVDAEGLWPSLEKGLRKALASVKLMRKSEGKSLAKDVSEKLKRMVGKVNEIQKRTEVILKEKKQKLSSEEFSSLQKNSDIHEEISRLRHYIEEMKLLLNGEISVGKKIDFIAQEMQRETNTMGSKLLDKIVSSAVIALKSKIEKIREQAQNIE